ATSSRRQSVRSCFRALTEDLEKQKGQRQLQAIRTGRTLHDRNRHSRQGLLSPAGMFPASRVVSPVVESMVSLFPPPVGWPRCNPLAPRVGYTTVHNSKHVSRPPPSASRTQSRRLRGK